MRKEPLGRRTSGALGRKGLPVQRKGKTVSLGLKRKEPRLDAWVPVPSILSTQLSLGATPGSLLRDRS